MTFDEYIKRHMELMKEFSEVRDPNPRIMAEKMKQIAEKIKQNRESYEKENEK